MFRLRRRLQGSRAPGKGAPGKVVVFAPTEHWTVGGGQKKRKNIWEKVFFEENKKLRDVTGSSRRGAGCWCKG